MRLQYPVRRLHNRRARSCIHTLLCLLASAIFADVCTADDWTPKPPIGNDGFDWIELKSGEWLKGQIKFMQDDELLFDSEELDLKSWDFDDIHTIRSSRRFNVRFGHNQVVSGSILVNRSEAQVIDSTGTATIARGDLLSIVPSGARSRATWSADVSAGATMRQGNTEELDVTTQTTLRRVTPMQRQKLEFVANYTKVDDDVSKDDQRWTLNSDYFVTGRLFVRLPDAEYLQDAEQNLDYRITLGCGVGYDLIKTHATDWQLTIGPAFQKTAYESVQSGTDQSEQSSALLLMSTFDTDLSKRLDLTLEYRGQFTTSEGGSNIHHGVATVEFEIHKRLILDISFVWDRIAEPEPDENGVTPEKDDYKIIMSLGVHL